MTEQEALLLSAEGTAPGSLRQSTAQDVAQLLAAAGSKVMRADTAPLTVVDPATAASLGVVADVGAAGVDQAVTRARKAQEHWGQRSPRERSETLLDLATKLESNLSRLAAIEALDVGKPLAATPPEITSAIDKLRFFAGACRILSGAAAGEYRAPYTSYVRREPVGVVGALAPWNYPFALTMWKIAPALAAGNTVVLKPSPETPLSALALEEIASDVLPDGVLTVVTNSAGTGERLVRHPDVPMISLTGGTATGRRVMAAAADSLKRLQLELGGNAPVLVFEDADLEALAAAVPMATFRNSGQDCHAASRMYVHHSVRNDLISAVSEAASRVRVGDNFDQATTMGPLVSAGQRRRVEGLVKQTLTSGQAEVAFAGPRDPGLGDGYYVTPTVLADAAQDSPIVQEEVFGPVISVTSFRQEEEVVRYANGVAQGLGASVWTSDVDRALRVSHRLKVGTVWVNGHGATIAEMPFGGVKDSGFGRDLSIYALEEYTELKHVAIRVKS